MSYEPRRATNPRNIRTNAFLAVLGIVPSDVDGIDGLFRDLDAAGLLSILVDGSALRTTQNVAGLKSFGGVAATIEGTPVIGVDGAITNGSNNSVRWATADTRPGSLAVVFRGRVAGQTANSSPWGFENAAGGSNVGASLSTRYDNENDAGIFTAGGSEWASGLSALVSNGAQGLNFHSKESQQHTYIVTNDNAATPTVKAYVDGWLAMTDSVSTVKSDAACNLLTLGGQWDDAVAVHGHVAAAYTAWLLFSRVLTDAEAVLVTRALRWLSPEAENEVFDGDSRTTFLSTKPTDSWPYQLSHLGSRPGRTLRINVGVNGAPDGIVARHLAHAPGGRVSRSAYFENFGAANLVLATITDGTTANAAAATCYNNKKFMWAAARAAGFKVYTFTIFGGTWFTSHKETARLALNALILSDPTLYDVCYRPELLLSNGADTALFTDDKHLTLLGNTVMASMVESGGSPVDQWDEVMGVVKTADTARTNTTTFADDDHLKIALGAGVWDVEISAIFANVSATSYGKVSPAFTGTADYSVGTISYLASGSAPVTITIPNGATFNVIGSSTFTGAPQYGGHVMKFSLKVAVAGILSLQWAQGIGDAVNAAVLKKGSYIKAVRIGS